MNENINSPAGDSPSLVKTIAVLTLVNGIVNVFWGLIAVSFTASLFFLWCLVPFAILPTILGAFEIIYALKLLNNPPQPVQPSNSIAILEILAVFAFNFFSMIVGILSLVFYNDPQVKEFFARINKTSTSEAPVIPTIEAETPAVKTTPKAPATPKPKKPAKRKVATKKTEAPSKGNTGSKAKKKEAKTPKKPKSE